MEVHHLMRLSAFLLMSEWDLRVWTCIKHINSVVERWSNRCTAGAIWSPSAVALFLLLEHPWETKVSSCRDGSTPKLIWCHKLVRPRCINKCYQAATKCCSKANILETFQGVQFVFNSWEVIRWPWGVKHNRFKKNTISDKQLWKNTHNFKRNK